MRVSRQLIGCIYLALSMAIPQLSCADEFADISKLYEQRKPDEALIRLERFLAQHPRDSRARFLKGVVLAEQNKTQEAIQIFFSLTVDFPEMPEPHNNLGVLYANQGDYEQARQALEMALRTSPSYALAQENLGDVYAALASIAYDKAAQLDKRNTTAPAKLTALRELLKMRVPAAAQLNAVPAELAALPSAPPAVVAQPAEPPPAPTAAAGEATEPSPSSPEPSATVAPGPAAQPAAPETRAGAVDQTKAVLKTVQAWARAWNNHNAESYLAFYAPAFKPPKLQAREQWEADIRARIGQANRTPLNVSGARVTFTDASTARVSFPYTDSATKPAGNARKVLVLIKQGERWLISQEMVTGK